MQNVMVTLKISWTVFQKVGKPFAIWTNYITSSYLPKQIEYLCSSKSLYIKVCRFIQNCQKLETTHFAFSREIVFVYSYNIILHRIERSELLFHASTWMNFKSIFKDPKACILYDYINMWLWKTKPLGQNTYQELGKEKYVTKKG